MFFELFNGFCKELCADFLTTICWFNHEGVYPAAVAIVASKYRTDDGVVFFCNEEKIVRVLDFLVEGDAGFVMIFFGGEYFGPERDDLSFILRACVADGKGHIIPLLVWF